MKLFSHLCLFGIALAEPAGPPCSVNKDCTLTYNVNQCCAQWVDTDSLQHWTC